MGHASGPADAICARVDITQVCSGRKGHLERLVQIHTEANLAQTTSPVLADALEGSESFGGGATAGTDELPVQLEKANTHGPKKHAEHRHAIYFPFLGQHERTDTGHLVVARRAHVTQ